MKTRSLQLNTSIKHTDAAYIDVKRKLNMSTKPDDSKMQKTFVNYQNINMSIQHKKHFSTSL